MNNFEEMLTLPFKQELIFDDYWFYEDEWFFISKAFWKLRIDLSPEAVAVLTAMSYYILPLKNKTNFQTIPLNDKFMVHSLGLNLSNNHKELSYIRKGMTELEDKGIITSMQMFGDYKAYKQVSVQNNGKETNNFIKISRADYLKIIHSDNTPKYKMQLIACYLMIMANCFEIPYEKMKSYESDTANLRMFPICYESLESIGERYGVNRKTAGRHVDALANLGVIYRKSFVKSTSINKIYITRPDAKSVEWMDSVINAQIKEGYIIKVL
ncbi:hypothetical protein JXA27_07080 [Aerococcaceae bacterium zg-B36]|uniref:hypothetical protein n=1 Tax=Aerococcaceae bacterium zg-252 TaxID=2796928 RepID=UPI001BD80AE6|nr:hypothetical protein [Aerococcaceae bacterium zg-B36]